MGPQSPAAGASDRRLSLADRVDAVAGVGPRAAAALADAFAIVTVHDLVEHYPRRHRDLGDVLDLSDVGVGDDVTLVGEVLSWRRVQPDRRRRGGRRLTISEGAVAQGTSGVFGVTFFNQEWRERALRPGTIAAFSGKLETFRQRLRLSTPQVQVLGEKGADGLAHNRLVPVYPATDKLPSWRLARWIEAALDHLPPLADWLPRRILEEHDLVDLDAAVRGIHLPVDEATRRAARTRLVFDELLTLQLGLQWRRARLEAELAGVDNRPVTGRAAQRFLAELPFEPTRTQRTALAEIGRDLAADRPMHRLLQGDVGSGKTVVALWAMLCAVDNGRQAALMVPTEVLAEQHHATLLELLAPLGVNVLDGVRVELLTSSTTTATRRRILGELLSGRVDIVVGTHALLEEGVRFDDLGVVVIDEQHRFGVSQRVQLRDKTAAPGDRRATYPDVLVMTATPIPRSLALTLYGDLDVTVLDELPPGRTPVRTELITPADARRRDSLYDFIREQARVRLQTYVVCPLVAPSDRLEVRSAVQEHERLSRDVFPDLTVELVHGQMRAADKEAAMTRFRRGEADVLVATTVVEVGVDVPAATVMVIEDAERFGISQLHQLRGRVGRGGHVSYCVLFAGWSRSTEPLTPDASARLAAVTSSTDGFALAETDLEIRGEGQLFGERQSGLPDLTLTRLQQDMTLVGATRDVARAVVAADPDLSAPDHAGLRAEVLRRYAGGLDEFAALATG